MTVRHDESVGDFAEIALELEESWLEAFVNPMCGNDLGLKGPRRGSGERPGSGLARVRFGLGSGTDIAKSLWGKALRVVTVPASG